MELSQSSARKVIDKIERLDPMTAIYVKVFVLVWMTAFMVKPADAQPKPLEIKETISGSVVPIPSKDSATSELMEAARKVAMHIFLRKWQKCGDYYTARVDYSGSYFKTPPGQSSIRQYRVPFQGSLIVQLGTIEFGGTSYKLDEADVRNGRLWSGEVKISTKAVRKYDDRSRFHHENTRPLGWSEWGSMYGYLQGSYLELQRDSSSWSVSTAISAYAGELSGVQHSTLVRIDCSQVPN